MAWTCTGRTNIELIENMVTNGLIHSPRVATAMKKVDRANYVRHTYASYEDSPQSIGHGATISAPHMHAHAAENLLPFLNYGSRVLDIGSGSGYTCAIFWHLISDTPPSIGEDDDLVKPKAHGKGNGRVIGIEHIPELVTWSLSNIREDGMGSALDKTLVEMIAGDGRLGHPLEAPYDAIHVGAAAPTIPQPLIDQLAKPGRMFIPVDNDVSGDQEMVQVDKDVNGEVTKKVLFGVRYVPLTDREKQVALF